jgi:hypothetical protein
VAADRRAKLGQRPQHRQAKTDIGEQRSIGAEPADADEHQNDLRDGSDQRQKSDRPERTQTTQQLIGESIEHMHHEAEQDDDAKNHPLPLAGRIFRNDVRPIESQNDSSQDQASDRSQAEDPHSISGQPLKIAALPVVGLRGEEAGERSGNPNVGKGGRQEYDPQCHADRRRTLHTQGSRDDGGGDK